MIHYNTEVIDADRQGKSPYDFSKTVTDEIINKRKDRSSIIIYLGGKQSDFI